MDRKPLLDTRIIQSLETRANKPQYALQVARIQALTYQHSGHFLALADEYVARKLKDHMGTGMLPALRVRCCFCYVVASLHDWELSCEWPQHIRDAQISKHADSNRVKAVRFLAPCDGAVQAEAILRMYATLCE